MEHNGNHYDLQSQLFYDDSCRGCAFIDTPCCMEVVGTECSRDGNWIWIPVKSDDK